MSLTKNSPKTMRILIATAVAMFLLMPHTALAHVKWFSEFSFADQPLTLRQAMTPVYLGLVLLSVIVIGGMVLVDSRLNQFNWYNTINDWLTDQKENSVPVMRAAMAAVLLISWASGAVLAPELISDSQLLIWLQFVIGILLIFKYTTPIAGLGLLALYLLSGVEFGFFHLIDYFHYAGIGFYLFVSNHVKDRLRELGLPALYATIGFSLMWLGYEKLIYPSWSLYLLAENPQLTLGLDPVFFLQGAAFVEIALGYLLIIGLLERPLAAVITLVFFTTTIIFGKVEIIGHTPLHAALIVFLFSGAGTIYKPPIEIHEKINWRVAFAAVNFVIVTFLVGIFYTTVAQWQFELVRDQEIPVMANAIDLADQLPADQLPLFTSIEVLPELENGYNLHVTVENWKFTPDLKGGPAFPGEGYAQVAVNGRPAGHLYGEWFYLGKLLPGEYEITVTLHGNDHSPFVIAGNPILTRQTIVVPANPPE